MPGMADTRFRLGIDLGTSNTVGCLRNGDTHAILVLQHVEDSRH